MSFSRAAATIVIGMQVLGCSTPDAPVVVTTVEAIEVVAPAPPDARVLEILAAAKKRVAADKALVSNRSSYERDLQRQLRQRTESQMQARLMPASMDDHALEDVLRGAATDAGVVLVSLRIEHPPEPTPVPSEHRGFGAYRYTPAQLFGAYKVTARLGNADDKTVGAWLEALVAAKAPLPFLVKTDKVDRDVVVEARCLIEYSVNPPWHLVEPLTISSLAAAANVEAPPKEAFGAELTTLDALIAEHTQLLPEIDRTLKALGRSHLEAERFRIYAQAADGIDKVLGHDHEH